MDKDTRKIFERKNAQAEKDKGLAVLQELTDEARDFYRYMAAQPYDAEVYGYDTPVGTYYGIRTHGLHIRGLEKRDLRAAFRGLFVNLRKARKQTAKED